ncbi:hypothetical protein PMI19_04394 [Pseudomonas sp. GM16]|nr:hypothetical protein PMI19_04394 [Pseudomonas sp. GM16]
MLPELTPSLASQLPQVFQVCTKSVFAENPCGSWLASDSNSGRDQSNRGNNKYPLERKQRMPVRFLRIMLMHPHQVVINKPRLFR